MNFFFGVNNKTFKSELQIPLFKNRSKKIENLKLFKCFLNKKWVFKEIRNKKFNKFFYLLKNEDIRNNEIYFLAKDEDLEDFDCKKLKNFNNYTETSPSYRANFKIYLKDGGFSSYQSEYPFSMIEKKGTILTPINTLSNKNADKNYILIKNIFVDPIEERFKGYLINIKNKKILEEYEMKTNFTNNQLRLYKSLHFKLIKIWFRSSIDKMR
jgi:hypothetical protein